VSQQFKFCPNQRSYILNHMLEAVAETEAYDDPFPYILIPNFFPTDTYETLLSAIPEKAHFDPFGEILDPELANRFYFRLVEPILNQIEPEAQTFWYSVRSALGSVELKNAVFEKLSKGIAYRFGCKEQNAASIPGYASPELFHETAGYQIKPHPDTRRKVVTMQIALPDDNSKEHLGTEFYRRSLQLTHWMRKPSGFEVVKTMPFLPNHAYAFSVINSIRLRSWHGRTTIDESSGVRNSILNIWYQKAEHANIELVRENERLAEHNAAA